MEQNNNRQNLFSSPEPDNHMEGGDDWWNFPGTPSSAVPVFELPDTAALISDITTQLKNGSLPLIEVPENIIQTILILDNPEFRYPEIAAQISHSPAMTGEILKLVNSPLINRGQKVFSLSAALPRLGRTRIKSYLYMYAAQMNAQKIPLFKNLCRDIVEHSYTVALIALYLSKKYHPEQPENVFLAGLFHDIGKLAILNAIANTCNLPDSEDLNITEESCALIFPQLHEKAGVYIALHWSMNEQVKAAILHHHDLRFATNCYADIGATETTINLVALSDTIARVLGHGRPIGPVNVFAEPAAQTLNITDDQDTLELFRGIPAMLQAQPDNTDPQQQ